VNTTRAHDSLNYSAGKNKSLSQGRILQVLALILWFLPIGFAVGEEPLTVCALPDITAGGLTLLLDPVGHTPVALLSDPDARLPGNRWPVVLQTVWDHPDETGLPHLKLADALPEFWAQPAVLMPFLHGPEAYAGIGTELRARDWAGLPATDRQSYRLDPGLKPSSTYASPPVTGGGSIRLQVTTGSLRLAWNGVAGRVYQLLHTANLGQPFQLMQTLIASQTGEVQISVPTVDSQGFYRLVEIVP